MKDTRNERARKLPRSSRSARSLDFHQASLSRTPKHMLPLLVPTAAAFLTGPALRGIGVRAPVRVSAPVAYDYEAAAFQHPTEMGAIHVLMAATLISTYLISAHFARKYTNGKKHHSDAYHSGVQAGVNTSQAMKKWLAGRELPTFEELTEGCYAIAREDTMSGREWFLCAHDSNNCEPDEDFTDYYGQPVYLCENVHW